MLYNTDYTNCKVLIRNEVSGESIAQTKIIEYNKRQLSIFVDARDFLDDLGKNRLTLLIFTNDSIHAFGGVARKSYSPRKVEISMFQGKEHDERHAKRYEANITAEIYNIFYPEDGESSSEHLNAKVTNLSTHGVMVETEEDVLDVNANFTLSLNIAGNPTLIKCLVVRCVENEDPPVFKYGCKFLAIEN